MGGTRPRPDYTAGFLPNAFTHEIEKLEDYASPEKPFLFTSSDFCFPFLMCEIKTAKQGLDPAHRQNMHSASISVRAIIELYKAAFGTENPDRVKALSGQVM
jgi:hypothetical protein